MKTKSELSMASTETVGALRAHASAFFQHPGDYLEVSRVSNWLLQFLCIHLWSLLCVVLLRVQLTVPGRDKPLTDDRMLLHDLRSGGSFGLSRSLLACQQQGGR